MSFFSFLPKTIITPLEDLLRDKHYNDERGYADYLLGKFSAGTEEARNVSDVDCGIYWDADNNTYVATKRISKDIFQ